LPPALPYSPPPARACAACRALEFNPKLKACAARLRSMEKRTNEQASRADAMMEQLLAEEAARAAAKVGLGGGQAPGGRRGNNECAVAGAGDGSGEEPGGWKGRCGR